MLSLVAIILLLLVLINLSSVQTYLAKRATTILSEKLNTKVALQHVRIDLLNHILLEGLYLEDHQHDTLAYIGKAELRMTDWFFMKSGTPVFHYLGLSNTFIHLYRNKTSNEWNYGFIESAFSSGATTDTTTSSSGGGFEFDLEKILLDNVRVHMDDAWVGYDYDLDFGQLLTNVDELNFDEKILRISNLKLTQSSIRMRDYKGGKPPSPKKPYVIDSTPFNPDLWTVKLKSLLFDDVHFRYVSKETSPYPNEFDPEYIEVFGLNSDINDIAINGDTVIGKMEHFSLRERSGFEIKQMQSKISVSPIASICRDLLLQTNNSTITDYYSMHYERFPDFEDYLDKVLMVANFKSAKIDPKDIAYFAPPLKDLPIGPTTIIGQARGTVADLWAKNLNLTDGFSTVKGDLHVVGLPDIDKAIFSWQNGALFTTGTSVMKYAPSLRDNPNLNIAALDFVYFNGGFTGLLHDFSAKGELITNLGNINADVHMQFPNGAQPSYSGLVSIRSFDLGRMFHQAALGKTTFNAQLDGASFDFSGFHIKAKSKIQEFTFNGYTYKDIVADGTFDKKRFDGQLLINDSNISLGFYGSIDFNQKDISVVATANLLSSNLKALNFVEAPTTLAADFDLNCSGQTIDDFIGTAKLYNINLKRHDQLMDLDSINIASYFEQGIKHIDIESNLLSARINGQYSLSEMPNSIQYYLSKYLPNYIKSPDRIATDQNLDFEINTHEVNDLLKAFTLYASGFDSSVIKGNLNTLNQSLKLEAQIPYGKIAAIKLYNTQIDGTGDFKNLVLSTNVDQFVVSDNLLKTSLDLRASLGNDSVIYTLATKSDDQYGTATINGMAVASNDTLYAALNPSELFLNNERWEIAGNNRVVFAQNYLEINNFLLRSGLQLLRVNTDLIRPGRPLLLRTSNIDLAQLASLTSWEGYNLEGRINGEIVCDDIFDEPKITSQLELSGVRMMNDSVGLIKIFGAYDGSQKQFTLEKSSGVFNPKYTLLASGQLSFDDQNQEPIDASVSIEHFPLRFLEPLLKGYVSKLSGVVDGAINIGGTFKKPVFEGGLHLKNALARIDYTGALYAIPDGSIALDQQSAILKDIPLFDVYQNQATATGSVQFSDLSNPRLNLRLQSSELELVNLKESENELFYGHVIGKTTFSITGLLNNLNMSITATPTKKSSLFLPYNSTGDHSTNNTYITFKTLGTVKESPFLKQRDKLSVRISAVLNNLIDVSLVLDPNTGDQISANGNGNLNIEVPANEDYSMFGVYNIDKGSYYFTFRQVLARTFNINSESTISFNGNIANTRLDVKATYPTSARLFDLLDESKARLLSDKELEDAKSPQAVHVRLQMKGTLASPDLSYEIELPEKRSIANPAYAELTRINNSDKTALTNQVSSLLFLGSFIPSQGITNSLAVSGAKTTMGEMLASQATPMLTSALNKLLGDKSLQVMVQYKSFGLENQNANAAAGASSVDSRNVVKFGLKKNYFNDRLSLQVGSAYDWGRPTTTNPNAASFNLAGDFRAQYLLTPDGGLSLVGFRSSNYDMYLGNNVMRTGMGITFRKSFDNFYEFIHSKKRLARDREKAAGVKP